MKTKIPNSKLLIFSTILFFGVFGLAKNSLAAANNYHYIRDGGTGDCSDWANACDDLPANLNRGDTYYLADGNYGGHNFNDPVSGTSLITIKKATALDHGTGVGWDSAYGDGQAVFDSVALTFSTSYYVLDGATGGGPENWTDGFGFAFTSSAGSSCTGISYVSIANGVSNIIVRHSSFVQTGDITACYHTGASGIANVTTFYDSTFEYLHFDNLGGLPFFFRGGSGIIIQYSYSGKVCGASINDYQWHCEMLVEHSLNDVHFRWNYIADSPSTGGFVKNSTPTSDSVRIYGNVFNTGNPIDCNTGTCTNWRIFNNSFVHNGYGPWSGDGVKTGFLGYNNITFDSSGLVSIGKYDWVSQIKQNQCRTNADSTNDVLVRYPNNCDLITETLDPFVNSSGNVPEDFRLTGPITGWPGYDVCQLDDCTGEDKYNIDALGVIRGADGVWDRGALEYQSGTDATAPSAPSGLIIR